MSPTANLRSTITCPRADKLTDRCLVRDAGNALDGGRCVTCQTTPDLALRLLAKSYPPAAWAYLESPDDPAERAKVLRTVVREYVDAKKADLVL